MSSQHDGPRPESSVRSPSRAVACDPLCWRRRHAGTTVAAGSRPTRRRSWRSTRPSALRATAWVRCHGRGMLFGINPTLGFVEFDLNDYTNTSTRRGEAARALDQRRSCRPRQIPRHPSQLAACVTGPAEADRRGPSRYPTPDGGRRRMGPAWRTGRRITAAGGDLGVLGVDESATRAGAADRMGVVQRSSGGPVVEPDATAAAFAGWMISSLMSASRLLRRAAVAAAATSAASS